MYIILYFWMKHGFSKIVRVLVHAKMPIWDPLKNSKLDAKRHIAVHAGTKNAFICGAKVVFSSRTKNADYNVEKNLFKFCELSPWPLLLLPNRSIITIGNVPYYNILLSKIPNTSFTIAEIGQWMITNNVEFTIKTRIIVKSNK